MRLPQTPWFEPLVPAHESSLQLFCFPYAGGSSHIYRVWQKHFSQQVVLSLVHLPGRTKRLNEPPFRHLKPLVDALAAAIIPVCRGPYAFWGHSMGALISFELARELRRRGLELPRALFVSGHRAPQLPALREPIFNLPDKEFIAELKRLNGTPAELLENPEMVRLFLPLLRADFQLVETYLYQPEDPLGCAIYAYGGLQDAHVPAESVSEWRKQTSSRFKTRMFPGDHFFIHQSTADWIAGFHRDVEEDLFPLENRECR